MPENNDVTTDDSHADDTATVDETTNTDTADTDATPEGADALGDAGKRALDSMKAKWKAERDTRRELERKLAESAAPASTETPDLEAVKSQAAREATVKANARILRSEIKAAATGKFADVSDALLNLDLTAFEVDENGDVDADEIADAIQEVLTRKPHLAAATAKRFQGTGDGGAARKASGPTQLTHEDLNKMSPEAIVKAKREGRLKNLLSGK
jgi:ribosomal protein L35